MTRLQGLVQQITFKSEETGFAVIVLSDDDSGQSWRCVGVMPALEQGESISVRGQWQTHPRFGRQFHVEGYELSRPTTARGVAQLLGSGLIPNIGPNRAHKIIERFGVDTLDILDTDPKRLLEISGIGPKMLAGITDAWRRQRAARDLMLFCNEFGIAPAVSNRIYQAYGDTAKERISANPYALIDDVWGIGFKKADAIARKLGFAPDSYRRIRAGIIYVLREANGEGHVYLPREQCIQRARTLLEADESLVVYSLDYLAEKNRLTIDGDRVYPRTYYLAEVEVAGHIRARLDPAAPRPAAVDEQTIDRWLDKYAQQNGWRGDPLQRKAVAIAAREPLMLLTGGPGTGKTTTLQVIVSLLRQRGRRIALAAPTGRAAQRMGSLAGHTAKTIHRLLEYHMHKGRPVFARNAENPIPADALIIDESSMIDLLLFRNLLAAVKPTCTLILVGDNNQLPSVGAGNALSDFIDSGKIPHVALTTIFRQAAKSTIVTAAHEIMHGAVPHFANASEDNCFFIPRDEPGDCLETMLDCICTRLPRTYGLDPVKDIQALSPMHRGTLGTQTLNALLQQRLNPRAESIRRGETVFAVNDKVMQIHNNYDKGVFNGDIGYIVAVSEESGLVVDFFGQTVNYGLRELDELIHAYCISIHKSQGCEFPAVVMPLSTQHYVMLQRNLLYTGLTRARRIFLAVGTRKALALAVKNDRALWRHSALSERIRRRDGAGN
jgi:exodeoxyribonuclease V alpha subunit